MKLSRVFWKQIQNGLFVSDTTAVEATTGWFVSVLALWCWLGGWFGSFLPTMSRFSGYEWIVAAVGVPAGLLHVWNVHNNYLDYRSADAFALSVLFSAFAFAIWLNQGWQIPGVPACGLAAIIQAWVFIRLQFEIKYG